MTTEAERNFIDVWMRSLATSAAGLNLDDADDRATFRGLVRHSMRHLRWDGMRRIAEHLGADNVGRSRDAAWRTITTLYIQRTQAPKKTAAQLDAEIAEAITHDNESRHHSAKRAHSKSLKLTDHQKTMLRMAHDTGRMSSGRYGWNEMHVRSLEKKGLVTLVSKATWDKEWKLTDLGREMAKTLHAAWLAEW